MQGFAPLITFALFFTAQFANAAKAPPSCYLTGSVYNFEKEISDGRPADRYIKTTQYQLVERGARCVHRVQKFAVQGTPLTLHMSYRAPCNGSGHVYEGRLTDDGYNVLYYSKYDPDIQGTHNVFSRGYFVSEGRTYSISYTCF